MALSKDKKQSVVEEASRLLADSKLTVIAQYQGTPVKQMQQLRRDAAQEGTTLRVIKNRLFKKALQSSEALKSVDTSAMVGQLLYAFNATDEVAPARSLAEFAKANPQIQFVAGITQEGQLLDAEAVKALASLPTKAVLRAQLIGTIQAPVSSFVNVLAGNVRGVMNVLNARADMLSGK